MIETLRKIIRKGVFHHPVTEKGSVEAYDLWSEQYDAQPGNLMLDLDEWVFSGLLNGIDIKNKRIADIGCGTGRHWAKMLQNEPLNLTGFDVSPGMLSRLQEKFPEAKTHKITDNLFSSIPDATYDVIVSTLTVAHIENIEEALQAWCRILKSKGDIIITDFHPNALAFGGKRTFEYNHEQIAVKNFVHYVRDMEEILLKYNFRVVNNDERIVDESVKHYYTSKNALSVYEKFEGARIIYGIHLRRGYHGVE
jgi:ubiquinone/menaquinone biosynthesis C-methylase UbiE